MFNNIDKWIGSYFTKKINSIFEKKPWAKPTHVIFCCVDHFEPDWNGADVATQMSRVRRWVEDYPRLARQHKDADGVSPRHTFFYPAECYTKEHLELLADLCRANFGEVEVHLHHDNDTEEGLREKLEKAKKDFSGHGLLGKRNLSGQIRFAFIHGNWCLNNSRPDGRWCGVNDESRILSEAGCYADFTFPSAPGDTQPKKINSIYYSSSSKKRSKTHDHGRDATVGQFGKGQLLIIQGPLTFNWRRRSRGIFPRIENANISHGQLPSTERVDLWVDQRISVKEKEDWVFIKVHTHGAPENNADVLLGEPMDKMFAYLEMKYNDGKEFVLHYTTAREMYNIIKAAEAGEKGSPGDYRNFLIERNI